MTKDKSPKGLINGIDDEQIDAEIQKIVDASKSDLDFDTAKNKFISTLKASYTKTKKDDEKLVHCLKSVRNLDKKSMSFTSKPTTTISVVMRNASAIEKNYCNITEATRGFPKEQKIGLAGNFRQCSDCGRIWDVTDIKFGDNCPKCSSTNSIILAEQAAPVGTIGILKRSDMSTGDISIYNTKTVGVLVHNGDSYEEAYIKFTGKQRELLNSIRFGIPFDINIDSDVFVNDTTGQSWYSTTGTSKVTPCSVSDFADIIDIYQQLSESLVSSVDTIEDGDYCALLLQVVDEPEKPKDKWLITLCDPDDEDEEVKLVNLYIEEDSIAKQLSADDVGIFECKFSEGSITRDGETETTRTININVESSGVPIYIMGEKGTKLISA